MKNDIIWDYWESLWNHLPRYILFSVSLVVIIGSGILVIYKGLKDGMKYSVRLVLLGYVFIIFCTTFICRSRALIAGFELMPFWSYLAYFRGEDDSLLIENITNIMVFVPVGFLLGMSFRSMTLIKTLLIGFSLSVVIESLQFVSMRGFAEFDDVMHNTLGCVMGYGLFRLLYMLLPDTVVQK